LKKKRKEKKRKEPNYSLDFMIDFVFSNEKKSNYDSLGSSY
jgi:hypothetical protein